MATTEATEKISAFEAERLIENLVKLNISEVGSLKWLDQHGTLEKLNIQAHKNLNTQSEEYISEAFLSSKKIDVLIYDLVLIDAWRRRVYPSLKSDLIRYNSMAAYFLVLLIDKLYHEATVINLLQVLMHHPGMVIQSQESILDVLDHINQKLIFLIQWKHNEYKPVDVEGLMNVPDESMFEESISEMDFNIAINCLSLLRSITDTCKDLPISALNTMLVESDMIVMLVQIIESSPWIRKQREIEKFEGGLWLSIKSDELSIVTVVEGQVWLSLMNLCLESECKRKYNYSKINQSVVLRLQGFISEETVNQLPSLVDLQRYLLELSMMNPPDIPHSRINIKPISDNLTKILDGLSVPQLIGKQRKLLLQMTVDQQKGLASRLADMYDLKDVDSLLGDPKCGNCGVVASQRCSICKSVWYCRFNGFISRKCQVKSWPNHKQICVLLQS